MSETNRVAVLSVKGAQLGLRLSLRGDQEVLCVSRVFLAAQLCESTRWGRGKDQTRAGALREALDAAGLDLLWGDELTNRKVTALDRAAAKFIRSLRFGPLVGGEVVARTSFVWRVTTSDEWCHVDTSLVLASPQYAVHLRKGDQWGSSPPNFGGVP